MSSSCPLESPKDGNPTPAKLPGRTQTGCGRAMAIRVLVARQCAGGRPPSLGLVGGGHPPTLVGRPPVLGLVNAIAVLTQALHTYIDLTQACANKTPAPTHANCDAPLARRLKNPKRRIANTDVSNATALTDTNIAKLHVPDSVVCEKNARLDTRELRCPPPPPPSMLNRWCLRMRVGRAK